MTQTPHLSKAEYNRLKTYLIDRITLQSEGDAITGETFHHRVEEWLEQVNSKTSVKSHKVVLAEP